MHSQSSRQLSLKLDALSVLVGLRGGIKRSLYYACKNRMEQRLNVKRKQRTKWLLAFLTVQRWMGRETIKSADTRDSYLHNLGLVCQRFGCTPDELVAQRIRDLAEKEFTQRERLEEQVRQFKAELLSQGEGRLS